MFVDSVVMSELEERHLIDYIILVNPYQKYNYCGLPVKYFLQVLLWVLCSHFIKFLFLFLF